MKVLFLISSPFSRPPPIQHAPIPAIMPSPSMAMMMHHASRMHHHQHPPHHPHVHHASMASMPFPENMGAMPRLNMAAFCQKNPQSNMLFTQENLDMVLYGYAKANSRDHIPGYALSGLRLGELSHGKSVV